VAFAETETTVSREHAHIRYDAESGKYRLYDSGSQRGTSIFRDGRRLEAPRVRGVQLRSGDEIHVGDARVRFETV
jgi:pSer/pThr/pTyr-binding forkhead associated (FHA) protein